jgi:hypothetical protein
MLLMALSCEPRVPMSSWVGTSQSRMLPSAPADASTMVSVRRSLSQSEIPNALDHGRDSHGYLQSLKLASPRVHQLNPRKYRARRRSR